MSYFTADAHQKNEPRDPYLKGIIFYVPDDITSTCATSSMIHVCTPTCREKIVKDYIII